MLVPGSDRDLLGAFEVGHEDLANFGLAHRVILRAEREPDRV
jgi:hypothetical protein